MRWLVTDIDGTITDETGSLYLPAIAALQELERQGIPVGLITGRPFVIVRMLGEYFGFTGPLIGENGGAAVWRGREFVLGSREIAHDALDVVRRRMQVEPTWDNAFRLTDVALQMPVDVSELQRHLTESGINIEVQVSSIMVHLARIGVTKFAGLAHLCEIACVDARDVVIAGDSDSDASLFRGFSISIAPSNCTETIAALAQYRAPSTFGAGFCEGLSHLRSTGVLP